MYGNRERGGFRPNAVPVREGEELDVRIEGIAEKGDGVAKKQGFVIFVPGAKQGEEVHIRISKVARSVAFAEALGPAQKPVEEVVPPKREAPQKPQEPEEQFDESKATEDF